MPIGEWHTLKIGETDVRFYFRQPAPDQWNAVSVLREKNVRTGSEQRRLMVGVGSNPDSALADLISRICERLETTGSRLRVNEAMSAHDAVRTLSTPIISAEGDAGRVRNSVL